MSPSPTHMVPQTGVEKSPFQISANGIEVNENVNRAHLRIPWLVVKWCNEQLYSFRQRPKWVNTDRAQYVRSLSSLIIIVVMTVCNNQQFIERPNTWQSHAIKPVCSSWIYHITVEANYSKTYKKLITMKHWFKTRMKDMAFSLYSRSSANINDVNVRVFRIWSPYANQWLQITYTQLLSL